MMTRLVVLGLSLLATTQRIGGVADATAASSSTDGPNAVMKRILHIFSRIEKAILGHDGILNYRIAFMCSDFPVFEDAICELQQVDISDLREGAMLVRKVSHKRYELTSTFFF